MLTVYSDAHRDHDANAELIDGALRPPHENARRADAVLAAVDAAKLGGRIAPEAHGLAPVMRVHDEGYVRFLETAWAEWAAVHGDSDALPLNWPARGLRHDRVPDAIDGKLGYYSFDAGTPITRGTWRAITAAADCAVTAARRVTHESVVFALCRPPGHHASRESFGGYCYLNNAAIAAQALLDEGASRIAVLDVDYHHGNGTQAIFYERADVLTLSLHADPAVEYPYFLGYADERGAGAGSGFNQNFPLPFGTSWPDYSAALGQALARVDDFSAEAVVVSLGVDTFVGDPITQFGIETADFERIGGAIARARRPTVVVLEGGYAEAELGENVVRFLGGLTT